MRSYSVFLTGNCHNAALNFFTASFVNGNYVISISQPWSECGTELTSSTEGDLVVSNKVWINKVFSFDLYDSPLGVASIQCTYESKLNVSTSIEPRYKHVWLVWFILNELLFILDHSSVQLPRPTVTGGSQYNAEITLCKVSTCSEACPDSYKLTGTAVYTVGQLLHVGIDLLASSVNTFTLPHFKYLNHSFE